MTRSIALALALSLATVPASAMSLSSSDIADGKVIGAAQVYSQCGGSNLSPQLSWKGAPNATGSFAIAMIDLDVKPAQFAHWIVVDLPANVTSLARGATLPGGARAIVNNFGNAEYDGPCPPTGSGAHHYRITIWALPGAAPPLDADAKATDIAAALEHAAIDKASLTGWYSR